MRYCRNIKKRELNFSYKHHSTQFHHRYLPNQLFHLFFLQNNIILQHLIQPATIYYIWWNLNESKKKNLGPVGARAIELSLQHFNSTERLQ